MHANSGDPDQMPHFVSYKKNARLKMHLFCLSHMSCRNLLK